MKKIPLTQGFVALVDDEDFDRVREFRWFAQRIGKRVYAARDFDVGGVRTYLYLHQFLRPGFEQVDHKDGNGLNNQKENIRGCSAQQNSRSHKQKQPGMTSRFRGVSWDKGTEKWRGRLHTNKKSYCLGLFIDETEAARAYDAAAREHFGEFAAPNFP